MRMDGSRDVRSEGRTHAIIFESLCTVCTVLLCRAYMLGCDEMRYDEAR